MSTSEIEEAKDRLREVGVDEKDIEAVAIAVVDLMRSTFLAIGEVCAATAAALEQFKLAADEDPIDG